MRRRTFILAFVVVLLLAVAAVLIFLNRTGNSVTDVLPGGNENGAVDNVPGDTAASNGETGISSEDIPTPTPEPPSLVPVVVSKVRLPVGERITADLLDIEQRPITNIALQGSYTFTSTDLVVGQITRVEIARGQEILRPMLALNPTDIGTFGSDLALHIPQGEVAIAFPLNSLNGVAYSMRPGDSVDLMMTLRTIEIDPEFRSPLPNKISLVLESDLLAGNQFLFGDVIDQGRLEFITELNQVAVIVPGEGQPDPVPKRVTQLSIQNAQVLWLGDWKDPRQEEIDGEAAFAQAAATAQANGQPVPTPTPISPRPEDPEDPPPSIVILSMTSQEALTLKWASERGVDIDFALRAPGDNEIFITSSVSLPQIIDQGGLAIPEPINFDLVGGN